MGRAVTAEGRVISAEGWRGAAWMLDCDVPAIRAVARVEAPQGGYLPDGQVRILFERHVFSRRTNGRFDSRHPEVSNPRPGGYLGGSAEHRRLREAVALDRDAALKSASWGRFQIMGFNYVRAGFAALQDFVNGMILGGEAEHLRAFVAHIRSDPQLSRALREHHWKQFAYSYNGPAYSTHDYDGRLKRAFNFELDQHERSAEV